MSALDTPDGVLVIEGIRKVFGQTRALDGVNLTLRPGDVVALLGENGAGKSTLANILDGVIPPDDGTMTIDGQAYRPRSPQDALRAGIGVVHQEISIVPTLSVAENLFLGMRMPSRLGLISGRGLVAAAREILDDFGLGRHIDPARLAGSLSIPTQQLVAIIKVLHRKVRVVILDEPTAAFSDEESELLFERMREFRQRGVALIYITHRLHEIQLVATRAVVLRDGRLISEHDPQTTPVDVLVRDMVGRSIDQVFPPKAAQPSGDPVLEVRALTSRGHYQDVSFAVRPGEIVGIAGLIGTGRSAILRTLAGDVHPSSGTILVAGEAVRFRDPGDAIGHGIVLAPEDRKSQGLLLEHSIQDNLALPDLHGFVSNGLLSFRRIHDSARRIMERMTVRGGRPTTKVGRLSGGNQQKVLLGRCIAIGPRVLLLDEPTRGVDVGARMAIYQHLVQLAQDGVAIVMVSSELEEVIGLCHRVGLMRKDRRFGGVVDADTDREAIMRVIVAVGPGRATDEAEGQGVEA